MVNFDTFNLFVYELCFGLFVIASYTYSMHECVCVCVRVSVSAYACIVKQYGCTREGVCEWILLVLSLFFIAWPVSLYMCISSSVLVASVLPDRPVLILFSTHL